MILNPNQMKNILVFTDFSYSSFNAVRYAALLAHSFGESKIILYHSYALNPTSEGYLPYPVDLEALRAESLTKLQDLELAIQPFFSANTTLELQTDDHLLLASNNLSTRIDLAVIGSKGQSNVAQLLYGSNAVNLIKNLPFPLLVIPSEVVFEPIKQVVLACELKDVEKIPVGQIIDFIKSIEAKLYVLNINPDEVERADTEVILQQTKLHQLLEELNPDYQYTNDENIAENMENFVLNNNMNLLIMIHKKHGFFHQLFHGSLTKKIAAHGKTPLLVLKEIETKSAI